jgi:hypothetical protein
MTDHYLLRAAEKVVIASTPSQTIIAILSADNIVAAVSRVHGICAIMLGHSL